MPASPLAWKLLEDISCVSFAQCGGSSLQCCPGSTVSSWPGTDAQWSSLKAGCVRERTSSLCGLAGPVGKHCLPLAVLGDVKERGGEAGSRVARAFPGL